MLVLAAAQPHRPPALRNGDVLLQRSSSSRAPFIRRASRSRYSHVGVVEVAPDGVFVLEAIQPVSRTPLSTWAARGVGREVTVLRPRGLAPAALERVVAQARAWVGRPYDARYRWDDGALYCSELVVKAFERGAGVPLGRRQRLDELALTPAERALAVELGVPADEPLVTPGSLDGDPHLEVVVRDLRWQR